MDSKAFKNAVALLVAEKNISEDVIYEAMELALTSAYKKNYNSLSNVRVDINRDTGDIKVYSFKTVLPIDATDEEGNEIFDERVDLTLEEARKIVPGINYGETIKMGSNIKVYISKVESTSKGPLILLSRTHYGFVKRLFELEIPEINEGIILVYSVAREAGVRTKVAVYSENARVDAVGSCIGEKGSRINRISDELNGEKIDVIEYSNVPEKFIENALSPAKNVRVFITNPKKQEAMVIVDNDNLSLAIGKKGLNVRLASKLTHYKIDVKTYDQAKEEGINILE